MKRLAFWSVVALVCAFAAIFSQKISYRQADHIKPVPSHSPVSMEPRNDVPDAPSPVAVALPQSLANDATSDVPTAPPRSFTTGNAKQKKAGRKNPQLLMVKGILRDYRAAIGQNPIGNNAEITKALLGANPRRARFITPDAKLNHAAELVDQRNHAYFFHQISAVEMEVRAAGPDGVMWTSDDEVSR